MTSQTETHNRIVGEVVRSIVKTPLDAGGSMIDVLVLLESVIVGVCMVAIKTGGDEKVLDVVIERARERLVTERFKAMPVASTDAALRPTPQLSGDACTNCGNFSLVRSGTCMTCQACGETTGCS